MVWRTEVILKKNKTGFQFPKMNQNLIAFDWIFQTFTDPDNPSHQTIFISPTTHHLKKKKEKDQKYYCKI